MYNKHLFLHLQLLYVTVFYVVHYFLLNLIGHLI